MEKRETVFLPWWWWNLTWEDVGVSKKRERGNGCGKGGRMRISSKVSLLNTVIDIRTLKGKSSKQDNKCSGGMFLWRLCHQNKIANFGSLLVLAQVQVQCGVSRQHLWKQHQGPSLMLKCYLPKTESAILFQSTNNWRRKNNYIGKCSSVD